MWLLLCGAGAVVVVMHTFKWFSLPMLVAALLSKETRDAVTSRLGSCPLLSVHRKVIRSDVVIMLAVINYFNFTTAAAALVVMPS